MYYNVVVRQADSSVSTDWVNLYGRTVELSLPARSLDPLDVQTSLLIRRIKDDLIDYVSNLQLRALLGRTVVQISAIISTGFLF